MKEYYTYAYLREDGTPYYIGKGKDKRIDFSYNRRAKLPIKERRLFLKKNLTEEEAFKHERYMIAVFGRKDLGTGILRNLTDGGDGISGCKRSEELKEKMSKINIGKKASEKTRNKISESRKGRFKGKENPCYGRKLTEEEKKKIIQRHYRYYTFISPDNILIKEYTTIREFSRKYNLERTGVRNIVTGKWKQYKGWKFISVQVGNLDDINPEVGVGEIK
jgi:group I intron endonuclease